MTRPLPFGLLAMSVETAIPDRFWPAVRLGLHLGFFVDTASCGGRGNHRWAVIQRHHCVVSHAAGLGDSGQMGLD